MTKFKAKARGYDGVKVREVGEVFDFGGKQGSWMEPVGAPKGVEEKGSKEGKTSDDKVEPPKAKVQGK